MIDGSHRRLVTQRLRQTLTANPELPGRFLIMVGTVGKSTPGKQDPQEKQITKTSALFFLRRGSWWLRLLAWRLEMFRKGGLGCRCVSLRRFGSPYRVEKLLMAERTLHLVPDPCIVQIKELMAMRTGKMHGGTHVLQGKNF
jgi:hypothetical protein